MTDNTESAPLDIALGGGGGAATAAAATAEDAAPAAAAAAAVAVAVAPGGASVVVRKQMMSQGDQVILFENYKSSHSIILQLGETHHNQFGVFHHDDMIGKPFGVRIYPRGRGRGWMTALHPTPELWTKSLPHRTQILYTTDISLVLTGLNVLPGSVVLESGTGSGSLSTSFARAVAPHGFVHTFEFNPHRVKLAQQEFVAHGVSHLVKCRERNVVERGFPTIEGGADAVFLDLPQPWSVINSVRQQLRPNGRVCSFSPCIEQVQRTCVALAEHGFSEIRTFETLRRTFESVANATIIPYFGPDPEDSSQEDAKKQEEEDVNAAGSGGGAGAGAGDDENANQKGGSEPDASDRPAKRQKTVAPRKKRPLERESTYYFKPHSVMPGHTGYLTFATMPWMDDDQQQQSASNTSSSGSDAAAATGAETGNES